MSKKVLYFTPLEGWKKKYVDTLLYPALRVGVSRWFGWVGLLCSACICSNFGELEPYEGRKKSNNPYLIKDSIDWEGDTVSVYAPYVVGKELVKKKIVYKRFFTYDDCFNFFLDDLIKTDGLLNTRVVSMRSPRFCIRLIRKGKITFPSVSESKIEPYNYVFMIVSAIKYYLEEKGLIGRVGLDYAFEYKPKETNNKG